jgi:hypothetical protein
VNLTVVVNWALSVTLSALLLGVFAKEARNLVHALSGVLRDLLKGSNEFLGNLRSELWGAVKLRAPMGLLNPLLGLALFAGAGLVVRANYHQMIPTIAFLLPVADAAAAVALAVVVMGAALGALLHAVPEHRSLFSGVVFLLAIAVGVLNWQRAEVILDGPLFGVLLLVIVFPVLLQVAEVATIFGGLHLAGPSLPLLAASWARSRRRPICWR